MPAGDTMDQPEQQQRHYDHRAEQGVRNRPVGQIAEQREYGKDRRPGVGQDAARGDAEPAQEQAGQETQNDDADNPADNRHANSAGSRNRSHSAPTSGSDSVGQRALAAAAISSRPAMRPKAQTAAPRTKGEGSSRQRLAASINSG